MFLFAPAPCPFCVLTQKQILVSGCFSMADMRRLLRSHCIKCCGSGVQWPRRAFPICPLSCSCCSATQSRISGTGYTALKGFLNMHLQFPVLKVPLIRLLTSLPVSLSIITHKNETNVYLWSCLLHGGNYFLTSEQNFSTKIICALVELRFSIELWCNLKRAI